ncbi:probable ATP-dependent DNA helicase HFM1 [Ictalurus punctatus]|uniref:Probable ATP-dependent DNA helicase HFM1 n=1 Tax=Ictalurus punctatus TaxID=7998 RepID=A0A2D0SW76_ICTPU|nr:probable ATP-dependent DNA helicase HFM1 [Ictalurus punctatus]XP_017346766.1 probable ATP-dependent DNA helicase HFM1 [Ictalurus punctatus]
MLESSTEFPLSLDNLFFDRPVVHKVKPLCQEKSLWKLDAAPEISAIPATQELQKEAESLASTAYSQKTKKFLTPLRRPGVSVGRCVQSLTDEAEAQQVFEVWKPEVSVSGFHPTVSRHPGCPAASQNSGEIGHFHPTGAKLTTRLFKLPVRKLDSVSIPATNHRCVSSVATATEHPHLPHAVAASCSPFGEFSQTEGCSSPQQNYSVCHPLTPKPVQIQGTSGPGILRPVSEIPVKFRSVFSEFPYFNYVQSKALDDVLYSSRNFVACAPTGSGKTVLFELAIIRILMETTEPWHDVKAVYMAPIKALCSQRYENWKQKFGPLGLNCKELTGDTEIDDYFEIQDAHLIMTTPEKWDSMTRKWRDNALLHSVQLFLIDEIHVVKDVTRGATLEVMVSRMKTMQSYRMAEDPHSKTCMRFVAVSATIPNLQDISEWLSDESGPATCLKMDESHRPVKLRKVVLGFPCANNQNEFKFDLSLNYKMASIIQTYSDQKPTLVFCSTRKGVQQSAAVLAKDTRFIMSIDHRQRLMKYANSILDTKLRDLIMCGVGYHHAGVSVSDRKLVEDAFTVGDLPVLFTTSTLAMGVNLPAHLVVIKSTMHYVGGACEEYSEADMLQMIGRAGRPQFDTSATAVIMTRSQTRDKYLQLVSGSETIESSLHTNLVEHLNAEIVLYTISDVNMALDWIRSTFLYIRALKNPKHYGFSPTLDKCGIETKLQELCLRNLNALASYNLITMDEDINIKTTESGKLMARYCVAFDTMKQFMKVTGTETLSEMVDIISKVKEFSDVQLRVSEKRTLNMLNKDKNRVTIRYPMEGKIKSNDMKVNCLIQAQLGCIPIQEFGLTQDTGKIFRSGIRLSKCLVEFLTQHSKKNFSAQLNAVILAKCFRAKLWEDSPYVSKQLDRIGLSLANAMVNAGLTSFSKIEAINARELELIVNRHPPFGNQIKEAVSRLPKYEVSLEQLPRYSVSTAEIVITVNLKNFEERMVKRTAPDYHYITLIIGDCDNNVVFQQKISDTLLLKSGSWSRRTEVTRTPSGDEISVNLISSEYVGLDIQQKFSAFYSGAKTFRAESYGAESPAFMRNTRESPQRNTNTEKPPAAQATVQRDRFKTDRAQIDPSKRQCNHFCKNKQLCGHECCKFGVQKRLVSQDPTFSSYLQDLKLRNDKLMETPVKRLKMRMKSEAEAINMQQFSYTPKEPVPAATRIQRCLATPQQQAYVVSCHDEYNENTEDFYSEMDDAVEEQAFQTNANTTFHNASMSREATNRALSRIPPGEATAHISHADLSTDGGFSSDVLNVNFDLALDDWDDFSDDNFMTACEDLFHQGRGSAQTTGPPVCVEAKPGSLRPQTPSRVGVAALPPQNTTKMTFKRACPDFSVTSVKQPLAKQSENISRMNFFTKRDSAFEEHKSTGRSQTDEDREVDMFLGIFDGIF